MYIHYYNGFSRALEDQDQARHIMSVAAYYVSLIYS